MTTSPELIRLENARASALFEFLRERMRIDLVEDIDPGTPCDLSLRWAEDGPTSLEQVLADTLDLHVTTESREVEVAIVDGVALSPVMADQVYAQDRSSGDDDPR